MVLFGRYFLSFWLSHPLILLHFIHHVSNVTLIWWTIETKTIVIVIVHAEQNRTEHNRIEPLHHFSNHHFF